MFESIGKEIRSPATIIALILFVISCLVGGLTSFYFYRKGIVQGSIAYQVTQVKVFDKESMQNRAGQTEPSLRVLDGQGQTIQENVYAAQIKLWNDGNGEIKLEDVRDPYRVQFIPDAKIITSDLTIPQQNNYDDFKLDKNDTLTWRHFDPGTGVLIRIIYSAKAQSPITIKGVSVGTPEPELVSDGPPKGAIGILLSKMPGGGDGIFVTLYLAITASLVFNIVRELLNTIKKYQEQVGIGGSVIIHLRLVPWRDIARILGIFAILILCGFLIYKLNSVVSTPISPF